MESYIGEEQLEVTLKQFIAKEHLEHLRKLGEGALSNISNSIITTKTASGITASAAISKSATTPGKTKSATSAAISKSATTPGKTKSATANSEISNISRYTKTSAAISKSATASP